MQAKRCNFCNTETMEFDVNFKKRLEYVKNLSNDKKLKIFFIDPHMIDRNLVTDRSLYFLR